MDVLYPVVGEVEHAQVRELLKVLDEYQVLVREVKLFNLELPVVVHVDLLQVFKAYLSEEVIGYALSELGVLSLAVFRAIAWVR